ncbi:NIMA (never in mitosis a)-related kinase, partial [Monoraphidium neglectum]
MAGNVDLSSEYEMREQIGKGAFGAAFLVLHKETRKQYVLKRVRLAKQTNWQRNSTLQERDMVSKLQHPYIVPHVTSWITQGHTVNVVYGYCEKGDLATLMAKNNGTPFPEATLKLWLCQMLLALEYLQVQKVLHRDIKTGNIFLTAAGDVQLGDFGLATYRETEGDRPEDMNLVGTPHYMSPELLSQKGCSFKSDTWSLGCALYELTAQRPAFNAFNIHGLVTKIRRHRMAPLPPGYSAEWGGLVAL